MVRGRSGQWGGGEGRGSGGQGEEEGSSCFEGLMPKELFSGAVLGAACMHISSLKFREELKETLWQGHKVSTG